MSEIPIPHRIEDAIALFDGLFADTFRTRLLPGDDEPLYLPANDDYACHRVIFAHGFFASALHELSHWCIAGPRRRALEDYGYWYLPDGRDAQQQHAFESVEIPPQALELLFSRACGLRFHVSVDNLGEVTVDRDAFRTMVETRAERYEREGLPQRAEAFRTALSAFYHQHCPLSQAVALGRASLSNTVPKASVVE
ncbi:hypothetical protein SAMN05661010_03683 [Modicisalibacter muralis]|uniref:Elongation factor P hydroxylase n=1 Tax=Modicisalibacter muralis TaxID=119000 RepID=A0A1G9REB7_9GAMM|nr:elongation factor P hydroxylase [Halomonas muralis]SDM21574.1 hypothetical protein SAMN05661010_03683 [Halomonas muralis]